MKEKFSINKILLTVISLNKRAIKSYMNMGFEKNNTFEMKRGNKILGFITMTYSEDV